VALRARPDSVCVRDWAGGFEPLHSRIGLRQDSICRFGGRLVQNATGRIERLATAKVSPSFTVVILSFEFRSAVEWLPGAYRLRTSLRARHLVFSRRILAWTSIVGHRLLRLPAVPTNGAALKAFYYDVERIWLRTLRRRSQRDRFSWQRMHRLAADWISPPRILDPYPDQRFAVTHPRWEPCGGIPPARIWAGGGP
jgi:hypothetical protein